MPKYGQGSTHQNQFIDASIFLFGFLVCPTGIPTKNMVSTYISQNSAVYLARVISQVFFIFFGGEEWKQNKTK